MFEKGIIRPSCSPIWIVLKKIVAPGPQKWSLVVYYRNVNEKKIDGDIHCPIQTTSWKNSLDLASGFHQIEMSKKLIEKTHSVLHAWPLRIFKDAIRPQNQALNIAVSYG